MDNRNENGVSVRVMGDFLTVTMRDLRARGPRPMVPYITTRGSNIPFSMPPTFQETYSGIMLPASDIVPSSIFAESCPACDAIAMDIMDPDYAPSYPKGWLLVACRRHAVVLESNSDRQAFVGGVLETRNTATMRYNSRVAEKKAAAAAIESSSSTCTSTHPIPSAPPPSPNTSGTSTPTTLSSAEKDPCPICVEDKPNLVLDCGHSFCKPCLTTWQQNCSDQKLIVWINSTPDILANYPILEANIKSRFTCPMCRTYLQYTKQSRRKRKMHNRMSRGEDWTEGSARVRRGGAGGRALRERRRLEREDAEDICDEATFRMPVVFRT
jgi:hypothetical protein